MELPPPPVKVTLPVRALAPVTLRMIPERPPAAPAPVVVKALASVMPLLSCTWAPVAPLMKVTLTAPVPSALLALATMTPRLSPEAGSREMAPLKFGLLALRDSVPEPVLVNAPEPDRIPLRLRSFDKDTVRVLARMTALGTGPLPEAERLVLASSLLAPRIVRLPALSASL